MTQEEKQLLLKDLSARLPYNVLVHIYDIDVCDYDNYLCEDYLGKFRTNSIQIKPYLRSMSSMTEEEIKEFSVLGVGIHLFKGPLIPSYDTLDWLNSHHFDYRNLIECGLALEALEGMYNIK